MSAKNSTDEVLNPAQIVETLERLCNRIGERFPDSGLKHVCAQLLAISRQAKSKQQWISEPLVWLRVLSVVVIVLIIVSLVGTLTITEAPEIRAVGLFQIIQALESGLNALVLIGATIFFLITLELRVKRHRVLVSIRELRAISHIIDMHQLTKDPERAFARGKRTTSSPKDRFTAFELSRYLDYCSEMLSLTAKIGVIYVQNFHDAVAFASVNEIETLTNALSRKIWQKIMIVHSMYN